MYKANFWRKFIDSDVDSNSIINVMGPYYIILHVDSPCIYVLAYLLPAVVV